MFGEHKYNWRYSVHCCSCGRFCKYPCDVGIPFGSCNDEEPPDEEFYCKKCAKSSEKCYIKAGWVPVFWVKPKWSVRVAKKLGYVEITMGNCAWTVWHDSNRPIPEGWQTAEDRNKKPPYVKVDAQTKG